MVLSKRAKPRNGSPLASSSHRSDWPVLSCFSSAICNNSQSRTRCSVCSALRLRRFRWGSLGEMGLALKASRTGIRGPFEADFSVLPHLSFLGFKVIFKKSEESRSFFYTRTSALYINKIQKIMIYKKIIEVEMCNIYNIV